MEPSNENQAALFRAGNGRVVVHYDAEHVRHAGADSSAECPERLNAIVASLKNLPVDVNLHHEPYTLQLAPLAQTNCCVCTYLLVSGSRGCSMCGSHSTRDWGYVGQVEGDTTYQTTHTEEIVRRAKRMIENATYRAPFVALTFCLTRPPGHHACTGRKAGFCHANFVIHALDTFWHLHQKRCAILDMDAHYGDGTVAELQTRPYGSFVSLHGYGSNVYPGTGARLESDRILSLPLPPQTTDAEYLQVLEHKAIPFLKAKQPDILLVSAGFDAHKDDTLAPLALSTQGFAEIGKRLAALRIPTFAVLEGGYYLPVLGESVAAFVSGFITSE